MGPLASPAGPGRDRFHADIVPTLQPGRVDLLGTDHGHGPGRGGRTDLSASSAVPAWNTRAPDAAAASSPSIRSPALGRPG